MAEDNQPSPGQEAIGTGLAAILGTMLGGPTGGVVGAAAGPHLSQLVQRAWKEVIAFRERQLESVVDQGADFAGVTPQELIESMQADHQQRRLLHDVLLGAADARDANKVRALARCLATGFQDAARVDEEALIVRALVDLDPVHVHVLAELERRSMTARDIDWHLSGGLGAPRFSTASDLSGPILTVLERNGLVDESIKRPVGGVHANAVATKFKCTSFGRECLKSLGNENRYQTLKEIFADKRG
ncbi:hypothetical protein [Kribbella deserti]|uniref:DUF4393 domain-containing protein n=1 Tax=Kribbella deserti TaxID=1926257 RepID=A0ABV6QDW2_9ACTN